MCGLGAEWGDEMRRIRWRVRGEAGKQVEFGTFERFLGKLEQWKVPNGYKRHLMKSPNNAGDYRRSIIQTLFTHGTDSTP